MIGTSIYEYVFIRTCIFLLRLVAPLSVFYSSMRWLVRFPFHLPRILEVWLLLESAFYLLVYLPRKAYLQKHVARPSTLSSEERYALFRQCHDHVPDPARYLSKWFLDAPEEEIRRENVKEFLRWAFLNEKQPDPVYDDELEEYVQALEALTGRELPPGRGSAKCLRVSFDKVEMSNRSLMWYLCVMVIDIVMSISLRYHYFHFYRTPLLQSLTVFPPRPMSLFTAHRSPSETLTYWYRPHTSKSRLPIVFVHGIGIGLYPYREFLAEINAHEERSDWDGDVGIIAIEIMALSSRITTATPFREGMCSEIHKILQAHDWDKFVLVSHSYGSIIASHMLHTPQISSKIGSLLFIDPVNFLLHLPDVAYNFLYRKPTRANEYQLSYFASKDMGISHTLFRRFIWVENILWKEDIQNHRVVVSLAGKDLITDTNSVGAYLTGVNGWVPEVEDWKDGVWEGDGLDVIWFPNLDHAQVFDDKRTRSKLLDAVRKLCIRE